MDCVFFNRVDSNLKTCHGQPLRPTELHTICYLPTEDDQKEFCAKGDNFQKCPRFDAMTKIRTC